MILINKLFKKNSASVAAILLLLLLGILSAKGLFTYYAFFTHDGDHHLARSFDAIASLRERHFPLRWAGSLNYYCGVPIFNFFYPLIYYLVFLVDFFVNNVLLSLKLIYFFTLIFTPVFFYLWLFKETKKSLASFTGAVLYLFVPYRFLLIFVRGSPEFMSYMLFPLLLFLISGLFEEELKSESFYLKGFLTALTGGLLLVSHNFVAMFLFPIIAFYFLAKIVKLRIFAKRKILFLIWLFVSFFGMAAFFIGPAWLEQKQIKLSTFRAIDYREHFPTLKQLIRSPWGYHYSAPGVANDKMSFMLGYAQWIVIFFSVLFLLSGWIRSKRKKEWFIENLSVFGWLFLSLLIIFLILPSSLFVWERITILQKTQFSWRLLGVTSFSVAALAGFLLSKLRKKTVLLGLASVFIVIALVGNRNHLLAQPVKDIDIYYNFAEKHPHRFATTTFEDDVLFRESKKACSFSEPFLGVERKKGDIPSSEVKPLVGESYRPPPFARQFGKTNIPENGKEIFYQVERGNTFGKVVLQSPTAMPIDIRLNLEYFPGAYRLWFNHDVVRGDFDCGGRICLQNVELNRGTNLIEWKIVQTPTQRFFNGVSLFFLLAWLILVFLNTGLNWRQVKKRAFFPLFLLILFVFSFFRFYQLDKRAIFDWDQERDAVVVKQILTEKKLTLIGPRVLGPGGFFLGPYFTYLLTPFYFFTTLHPQAVVLFIVAYNLIFFCVAFWVLQKLFSREVALIFLLIWAIHPSLIGIDTIAWNPVLVPLITIGVWYAIAKSKWFLVGFLVGLGVNFHLQMIFLLPFCLIFLLSKSGKVIFSELPIAFSGFIITFLPLLAFDLRHNFLNIRLVIDFISEKSGVFNGLAWLPVWQNVVSGFVGKDLPFLSVSFYFSSLLISLYLWRREGEKFRKGYFLATGVLFFVFPFGFVFYGRRPSEYYFNFLYPFFVLLLACFLLRIIKNWPPVVLLIVLLFFSRRAQLKEVLRANPLGLYYKEKVVQRIAETGRGKKFNVSFSVPLGLDSGYRYLLEFYRVKQSQNLKDPLLRIVIPPEREPVSETFGAIGLFIPANFVD